MSKYSTLVQWSDEDNAFIATVSELPGLSAFGSSQEEAVKELSIAKKAFLEVLEEDSEQIPEPDVLKPFSGQTRLRLPKDLHQSLVYEAKREGISLNSYIVYLLSQRNIMVKLTESLKELRNTIVNFMLSPKPPVVAEAEKELFIGSELNQWAMENQDEVS